MSVVDLLTVYNFDNKIRYGDDCDGGYVIGKLDGDYDCYISAGISDEESFSRDFINKYNMNEYNSFGFDGTITKYPYNYTKKISFIKKNISNVNDDNNSNLSYLMSKYNNIFLKMDIEGGEYNWLLNIDETQLDKFKQIAIEFHGITNDGWNCDYKNKLKCLEKLAKTHYIIHAHGNNYGPVVDNIPDVIELTYVNKNYFNLKPELNTSCLPSIKLDFPNNKQKNDIQLTFYPFVNNTKEEHFDKVIHITYKNIEKLENVKNQWLTLNPEYSVELYDDTRCVQFLNEFFGKKYSDIFNYIQDGPIKSDFFRICVLYIYGGVYVDADIKPLVPLDEFIDDDTEFATCISYNYKKNSTSYKYNPHFIVSKKYNSYLYETIKKYELIYAKQTYSYWDWSICNLFNISDFDNYINNVDNSFVLNNKKYILLVETLIGDDNNVYNFTNICDENNKLKCNYTKYAYCVYNSKNVLENFTNKPNLV